MSNKEKFTLTEDHICLLCRLNIRAVFSIDNDIGALPTIDTKRLFGNGTSWREVAGILNLVPERNYSEAELNEGKDEIDGYPSGYSQEQVLYCKLKIAELIPALEIVLQNKTFVPREYEIDRYGAFYSYKHAKNYIFLRPFIDNIEKIHGESIPQIHTIAMNLSCEEKDVFTSLLEELSFGDETGMRKKHIKWLNYTFDELHKIIDGNNNSLNAKIASATEQQKTQNSKITNKKHIKVPSL